MEPSSLRKQSKTGKKCLFWPQKALLGAPEVLGGPQGAKFCPKCHRLVRLMITTCFGLVTGLFWTPKGPKRACFGPKIPFWGPQKSPMLFHCIAWYCIVGSDKNRKNICILRVFFCFQHILSFSWVKFNLKI